MSLELLAPGRLRRILADMAGARVGVLGDFCLDVYWALDLSRSEASLETGKATRPVRRQRCSLGGAGNVVANLAALGVGTVRAFGAVGKDPFGRRLLELLGAAGVDAGGMRAIADEDAWQTLTYCKPFCGDEEQPRLDFGCFNCLPDDDAAAIVTALEGALDGLDVVVINEQVAAGLHTPRLQECLTALLARRRRPVMIFDGRHLPHAYPGAWLKVNEAEAARLAGLGVTGVGPLPWATVETAARALWARRGQPVFVTRGRRGAAVCAGSEVESVPGLRIEGPVDSVGAGDAFLAGLAAATAAGAGPGEALQVGNLAGAVTVTKLHQTGTASPAEIIALGTPPRFAAPE